MYNPYTMQFPYPQYSQSSIGIPHVKGMNEAQSYNLPSNSSILLLDETAPIVYLVKTDSACYKTVTPYTITEYKPKPIPDMESLLNRIELLERKLNNESDTKSDKPTDKSDKNYDEPSSTEFKSNGNTTRLFGK